MKIRKRRLSKLALPCLRPIVFPLHASLSVRFRATMTANSSVEGTARAPSTAANIVLWSVLVLFVLLSGLLVAGAMTRRETAEFLPTPIEVQPLAATLVIDTVTIDARDEDAWRWFSFQTRSLVASPIPGWDLGFRRFSIVTASGAIDLGPASFDDMTHIPDSGFTSTRFGSDTTSAVFEDWYRYSFISHMLESRGHTYIVETRGGGHAKVRFLSYYCPESTAGCVTFIYAYQPNDSTGF